MGTNGYADSGELEDEAVAKPKESLLIFEDDSYPTSLLTSLDAMRRNSTFCDASLRVENVSFSCHRAVLASASPYLMEAFSDGRTDYRLEGFCRNAIEKLVDYVYTSRLELTPHEVRTVFEAATRLKIERVVKECSSYLVKNLNPDTAIEIRALNGIARDKEFVVQVDSYINKHFEDISKSPLFLALPCLQVEVLSQTRREMSLVERVSMSRLVFDWLLKSESYDRLVEKTHMLYLALDNTLQDCSDLPTGDIGDTQIVQDYKRLSKVNGSNKKRAVPTAKPRVIVYTRNISDSTEEEINSDDRVIASTTVSEHAFLALASIWGRLASLSIVLRLNPPNKESADSSEADTDEKFPQSEDDEITPTYFGLSPMASVKCAAGCANLNNRILVCGGYDRGECLREVQMYDPLTNKWKSLAPMICPRGRFNITVIDDKAYAVGGCDGTSELTNVEMFSESENRWEKTTTLPLARSHTAVCSLNGLVYCIGGFSDQVGMKRCDVFDVSTGKWSELPHMMTGRYQAAAVGYQGRVWVVGGCDGWSCLSSVEIYDPVKGRWSHGPQLNTARRGLGLTVYRDRLYVVGGWDGTHSLSSTEILESGQWIAGPTMTTPRSNLGLAAVDDSLYAVGGFSNKMFLNSIEVLKSDDWTTFCLIPDDQ